MSIFANFVRDTGGLVQFNEGGGAPPNPVDTMGLRLDTAGAIFAQRNGQIDHYHNGLPFNLQGRLMITGADPVRVTQGIAFSASDHVCQGLIANLADHFDQGVALVSNGALAQTL